MASSERVRRQFLVLFDATVHYSPSILVAAIGLSYLFMPVDLIPDRTPYIGHLDEISSVLGGLFVAYRLAPDSPPSSSLAWPDSDVARRRATIAAIQIRLRRRRARLAPRLIVARASDGVARLSRRRKTLFTALGYRCWWRLRAPFARTVSGAGVLVIGGAARSGTTLLQTMLSRHPAIMAGPEATVFLRRIAAPEDLGARLGVAASDVASWQRRSRSQMEFADEVRRAMLADGGATVWAEKTPANVRRFRFIRNRMRQARFVHVIRDGRDVVCSLRERSFAKLDGLPPLTVEAAFRLALLWRDDVETGLLLRGDPRYIEIRYEDLVSQPRETLARLLNFAGLEWHDAVLDQTAQSRDTRWIARHDTWSSDVRGDFTVDAARASGPVFPSSVGRWRTDLGTVHLAAIESVAWPTLMSLGYAESPRHRPTLRRRRAPRARP